MSLSMSMTRPALLVLAAALWCAPAGAADPHGRLQAGGMFISVNEMVAALSQHCPGDYGDAPYGAEGALEKLKLLVPADEWSELSAYVGSSAYAQEQRSIQEQVRQALSNIAFNAQDDAEACRILAGDILLNYDAIKAVFADLR